jgi:hypothetical protein
MAGMYSGMSLLQSDFSRHSLLNLLGPAELRMLIISHARISFQPYLASADVLYRAQTVLGPDSVGFPRDRLGKAKSSDIAASIPECFFELYKFNLSQTKWERSFLKNRRISDKRRLLYI